MGDHKIYPPVHGLIDISSTLLIIPGQGIQTGMQTEPMVTLPANELGMG